jgi:transposase-like protein
LDSVIKPNYRYANIFREKLDLLIKTGYRSLRKACEDFQNFFNVLPSHQTIQNWLRIEQENMIKNVNSPYSGYYCYDEQYVKIKGTWMYRLTLYDHILNIPLAEQIAPDKEYETIKQFLIESTENKQFIGVTTDHVREYKSIMDELGVKHQLCIFHLYKMIADKIYHVSKSKKTSKNEKELLNHYFKEIRNIFNTEKEEIAKTRLEQLLNKFDDIPRVLQKFISKKIIPDFYRLTEFMRDHMMSRTSNPVENYFRQTFPKEIKKKYKTIREIITYLWRKMQYWTQKHGQHPQHPTT